MPFEVVMPRLGWNMEKGTLVKWCKQEGEYVQAGEALFVVEADKATQEVEALESGILHIPPNSPAPGTEVPVGTLLAYLLQPGEKSPLEASPATRTAPAVGAMPGPKTAEPVSAARPGQVSAGRPSISPRARRVARELGVDWTSLKGSGHTGRIVERDVRDAVVQRATSAMVAPAAPAGQDVASAIVQPVTPTRRLVAERMAASAGTVAAVTLTTEADATELVMLWKQLMANPSHPAPSYGDLLLKLLAQALMEHPTMNARLEGDSIVLSPTVNLGFAVDTEQGLMIPVLRDAQTKSLLEIARESAALIEAARTGRISPDELHGGTFTLAHLGMYEIDTFTPLVHLPECAILGVGRIVPKPVVVDADTEHVAVRHMMSLSLTFDHRLVGGAPAARFLERVKQYIEQPYLLLLT